MVAEVTMVAELNIVTEWFPEHMEPGTIFVLENAGEVGDQDDLVLGRPMRRARAIKITNTGTLTLFLMC